MQEIRSQKLAEKIQALKQDMKEVKEGKFLLTYCNTYNEFETRALLECKTMQDMHDEVVSRIYNPPLLSKDEILYRKYVEDHNSKLYENMNKPALHLFTKWYRSVYGSHNRFGWKKLKFRPGIKTPLGWYLETLAYVINSPKISRYLKEQIKPCFIFLRRELFDGIGFPPHLVEHFLLERGLETPSKKKYEYLNPRPSCDPIPEQRAEEIIKYIVEKFLSNPKKNKKWGESLILIWVALSASRYIRRGYHISKFLKMKLPDIQLISKSKEVKINYNDIENSDRLRQISPSKVNIKEQFGIMSMQNIFPISNTLKDILLAYDCEKSGKIFTIERSTLENHIAEANVYLGYDQKCDPVSPETFLSPPHRINRRHTASNH